MSEDVQYHLRELEVARNLHDPRHAIPAIPAGCRRILDIGCGAGQTLIAADRKGAAAFGIDYGIEGLRLGKQLAGDIHFVRGSGERLPYADRSFDFVLSRVALPYMRIPVALGEINRVLQPGGHLWCTLHPLGMMSSWSALKSPRRTAFDLYRFLNAATLHFAAFQFRYPLNPRWTESYQTAGGMRRSLRHAGFEDIAVKTGAQFMVTARKAA